MRGVPPAWERRSPECRKTQSGAARHASPFPRARQLPDLLDDELALDAANAIQEEHAVKMIHLVLQGARHQFLAFHHLLPSVAVKPLYNRPQRPRDGGIEPGHAEAPFLLGLHTLTLDERGIDERHELAGVVSHGQIHYENAQRCAELWYHQTGARSGVHGIDHVVDQLKNALIDVAELSQRRVEDRVAEFKNPN